MMTDHCPFCAIIAGTAPGARAYEDEYCIALMDIHPIASGHVLVIPRCHEALLTGLRPELIRHLFGVSQRLLAAQRRLGWGSAGSHLLVNDGKGANQHVPHVHIHLIPRYRKDGRRALTRLFLHATGLMGRRADVRLLEQQAAALADALVEAD